jgi:hypothetical protein
VNIYVVFRLPVQVTGTTFETPTELSTLENAWT